MLAPHPFYAPTAHTDGVWVHTGTLVVRSALELQPSGGTASLILPDGIITTPMLAPNAAQEQIGSYAQLLSWTLPQAGVWTETPIQVTLHFSGVRTRIEFNVLMSCPVKGQRVFYAIMVDGTAPVNGALGALDAPENGYAMMAAGTYYFTPAVGTRRFAFGVNGPAGVQIFNVITSTLYVTEQKR